MKKIFIGLVIPVVVVLFSSCLGSTKWETEQERVFSYMPRASLEKDPVLRYAVTKYGDLITSPDIQDMPRGTSGLISYKISEGNLMTGTVLHADYARFDELFFELPFRQTKPIEAGYDAAVTTFSVQSSSPINKVFEDRWHVRYTTNLRSYRENENKDQKMVMYCYYDEDNQFDQGKKGEKGPKVSLEKDGKIIIDIAFKKTPADSEINKDDEGIPKMVATDEVINLELLRQELLLPSIHWNVQDAPLQDAEGNAVFTIKFRYNKEVTEGDKTTIEPAYLGDWYNKDLSNIGGGNYVNSYIMVELKPDEN